MYQKVVPPRNKPKDDKSYFEILSKAVFNAGFSYQVVRNKWEDIKEEFHEFDPKIISKWTVDEISKALNSPKIIRNSRKVNAIVSNAKIFLEITKKHGSFENYLNSFREEPYEVKQKILSKRFKWLGPTGAHFFLWSIGEDAPPSEQILNHK
ncbi:hypothetical protein LCGC14_1199180 [marine sediment metagenome]|uniref:DNA-3-methyladenine glycosylase I n=1 Tax=marine sediment metagenome TaxID=412755 RepID=A0A0F9NZV9_9ZZZZ|nr:hypothetical protein [archaeon]